MSAWEFVKRNLPSYATIGTEAFRRVHRQAATRHPGCAKMRLISRPLGGGPHLWGYRPTTSMVACSLETLGLCRSHDR